MKSTGWGVKEHTDTYIFDMDGTLCDISHRLHFIQRKEKDWDSFFKACVDDIPKDDVIQILKRLHPGVIWGTQIVLITGRSISIEAETREWLKKHIGWWFGKTVTIFFREEDNHRPDHIIKKDAYNEMIGPWMYPVRVIGVFEDRQSVVDMWREEGLTCFQVDSGDF